MPKLILETEISSIDFSQYSYVGVVKRGRPDLGYVEIAEAGPAYSDEREPLFIAVDDPDSPAVIEALKAAVLVARGY